MSEIKKEVPKIVSDVIGLRCDGCSKISYQKEEYESWHTMRYGNYDHDEPDWQTVHVCSIQCYAKILQSAIYEQQAYDTAEIDNFSVPFAKEVLNAITKKEIDISTHTEYQQLQLKNKSLSDKISGLIKENEKLKKEINQFRYLEDFIYHLKDIKIPNRE